jgi:hypothetical protein
MSLPAELIEKIKQLPAGQQMLVKSLVDQLARVGEQQGPLLTSPWFGSLEHLGIDISEDDIADARREMWGSFPRELGT